MPLTEETAVLNIDSSQTLTRLAHALTVFARIIPGAAVAKVSFSVVPFVDLEQDVWRVEASLICMGALNRTGTLSTEDTFLDGVEPVEVCRQSWAGEGPGCDGAIEELATVLDKFLTSSLDQRQEELVAVQEALTVLANPVRLQGEISPPIWLRDDPSKEE